MLTPPPGFTWIEETLCRSLRVLESNADSCVEFLNRTNLQAFVNVSGIEINDKLKELCSHNGIVIYEMISSSKDPFHESTELAYEWLKNVVELTLSLQVSNKVLLMGSEKTHYDCLIVAIIRKMQSWSITSIVSEYRQLCSMKRYYDIEQLIETYPIQLIELNNENIPEFLILHYQINAEETQLLAQIEKYKSYQTTLPLSMIESSCNQYLHSISSSSNKSIEKEYSSNTPTNDNNNIVRLIDLQHHHYHHRNDQVNTVELLGGSNSSDNHNDKDEPLISSIGDEPLINSSDYYVEDPSILANGGNNSYKDSNSSSSNKQSLHLMLTHKSTSSPNLIHYKTQKQSSTITTTTTTMATATTNASNIEEHSPLASPTSISTYMTIQTLFFNPDNILISSNSTYDPAVSLIADKDDDD